VAPGAPRAGAVADPSTTALVASRTDPRRFGELYEREHERLFAYFYRRTFCVHTANDLTQETFARALRSLDRFDVAKGTAGMWLWGIASRVLTDFHRWSARSDRALRRIGVMSEPLDDETSSELTTFVDVASVRHAVRVAVAGLPDKVRQAVTLRVLEDKSYDEVAAALGCTVGAARVRVCRGLKRLEVDLGDLAPPAGGGR
jgi:RNA polymerase sigma-70 factor (ECF subfamily)